MTTEKLYGFIGDVRGNEENLVAMDAVSVDGDAFTRYPAGVGVAPTELSNRDLPYVIRVEHAARLGWRQGDIVWFIGPALAARIQESVEAESFLGEAMATSDGYFLRAGTAADFRRVRDTYAELLSVAFRLHLIDSEAVVSEAATKAWKLFAAFDSFPTKRRSINAALYYYEVARDQTRYRRARTRAVQNGAFESVDAFDEEYKQTVAFLQSPRLCEVVAESRTRMAMDPHRSAWVADAPTIRELERGTDFKHMIPAGLILALTAENGFFPGVSNLKPNAFQHNYVTQAPSLDKHGTFVTRNDVSSLSEHERHD